MQKDFTKQKQQSRKRNTLPVITIFCEGTHEEEYFNKLRVEYRVNIKTIQKDEKQNKLIEFINNEISRNNIIIDKKDSIYAILDVESNKNYWKSKVKPLIKSQNKIKVIISNSCFEIWLLLHFKYTTSKLNPKELNEEIKKELGAKYKSKMSNYFQELNKNIDTAIKNAKKLIKYHKQENRSIYDFESNPITNMYELIETIKR